MEKIKVSREVAEFIKSYEENMGSIPGWENSLIVEHSRTWANGFEGAKELATCMKYVTPTKLSKILIYGHEVEQTPEEHLLKTYKHYKMNPFASSYNRGFIEGITLTLNTLDIKVKGINV